MSPDSSSCAKDEGKDDVKVLELGMKLGTDLCR